MVHDQRMAKSSQTDPHEADIAGGLSALIPSNSIEVYIRAGLGEPIPHGTPGLSELLSLQLLLPVAQKPDHYAQVPVHTAARELVRLGQEQVSAVAWFLSVLAPMLDALPMYTDFREGVDGCDGSRCGPGKATRLLTGDQVNKVIERAAMSAQHSWLTAQPNGPRSAELLNVSVDRDTALLRRGVQMRTIYHRSAISPATKDGQATAAWVGTMTGLGAEIRTTSTEFPRIIMRDNVEAFIPDLMDSYDKTRCWHVTHPGVVLFIRAWYEQVWERSQPWRGREEGTITTQLQRWALRGKHDGKAIQTIAKSLGVSVSRINKSLADLRQKLGVDNDYAVMAWFARSPEWELD